MKKGHIMHNMIHNPILHRNPQDVKRFPGSRRYMIGRETAIQKMRWTEDDWLIMDDGSSVSAGSS